MKETTKKLTLSAMFMVIGLVLPFFTGQIPQIGNMMLPMHFPVFLCGLICGWKYGAVTGAVLPLFRSLTFGMPPLFPTAIAMAVELAVYGMVAGYLYGRSRWQCVFALYRSLIIAMITGRIAWGIAQVILLGISGSVFTWRMFLAGAFLTAIPGIMIQLILIPLLMVALNRTGLVYFQRSQKDEIVALSMEGK